MNSKMSTRRRSSTTREARDFKQWFHIEVALDQPVMEELIETSLSQYHQVTN